MAAVGARAPVAASVGQVVATEEDPSFEQVTVALDAGAAVEPGQFLYAAPPERDRAVVVRVERARDVNPHEVRSTARPGRCSASARCTLRRAARR